MADEVGITGVDEVISAAEPLIDVDVPATPATAADEQKTEAAAEETPEQQEVKKESRRQRAIRRERDGRVAAETENRILRDQLAAKETKAAPQDGEPKRENFEDYEAYQDARADWRADQREAAKTKASDEASQGKEAQTKQATAQQATAKVWEEREKAFIGVTKDYEATVGPYAETELGELSDGTRRLIVDSEVGPQLLDHLARNPEVHDRIAGLSPLRQIVELGKLEDKFEKTPEGKKISTAPAPIRTVSGGSTNSGGNITEKSSQADVRAFMQKNGSKWVRPAAKT